MSAVAGRGIKGAAATEARGGTPRAPAFSGVKRLCFEAHVILMDPSPLEGQPKHEACLVTATRRVTVPLQPLQSLRTSLLYGRREGHAFPPLPQHHSTAAHCLVC